MKARLKDTPPPPAPEHKGPVDDGVKRPRQLMLVALVAGGLWNQLWVVGLGLIPIVFAVTWAGRWERRHTLMALSAPLWVFATAAVLGADPTRASLGLGWWNPPAWLADLGQSQGIWMLALQALGIGVFAWAADGMRSLVASKRS